MSDVGVRSEHGVLEITLRRVAKRNALTAVMYEELARLIEGVGASDEVRAVVVAAEGVDFCAGNDLPEFLGDYELAPGSPWRRFLDALPVAAKPLLAAVQGNAVGIGMTMLLHFDFVWVEPTARLAAPFARLGVVPEAGSSGLLRARVGPQRAAEVFLLGRAFSAEEAVQLGLANALVPAGQGRAAALQAAQAIAQLPVEAVCGYLSLKQNRYPTLAERIDAECRAFMQCLRTPQTRSIIGGIVGRRPGLEQG
jgi:enoyl-CoA hydratase/carnithine racemase